MAAEFIAACKAALPGAVVSCFVSGVILHYLRAYIDHKLKEENDRQEKATKLKVQRSQLEMQRRKALGSLLYWLHRGLIKPPPNGELEKAMAEFNKVENQQHELEQKILAGIMVEEDLA